MRLAPQLLHTALLLLSITACTAVPDGVQPVQDLELKRYLGTWYEIARLDHSFERGLEQVTATYTAREDGGVTVTNRGYSTENGEWEQATGKAYPVDNPKIGHLKVSFFGPFYTSYVIFGLDQDEYQYAFVSGPHTDYLWLLSRQPELDDDVVRRFVSEAKAAGFDTDALIFVRQDVTDF